MRSALSRYFIFFALVCGARGLFAPAQVNPHTQIRWPSSCNAAGMIYNYQSNTCISTAGVTWRGAWAPGTYALNDMVSSGGNTYISTAANNTTTPPSSSWALVAAQGSQGPPGPTFNGGTITNPLNGTTLVSNTVPMRDLRHPDFAGGLVSDDVTDNTPVLQAGLATIPTNGGNMQLVCGNANGQRCYVANPQSLTWPSFNSSSLNIFITGTLKVGTTFGWPAAGRIVNLIGLGGSTTSQFQPGGQTATILLSPATGTCRGTLGTAVSTTVGTKATVTFTPSAAPGSNPCFTNGAWITVVDTISCPITSISRATSLVTSAFSAACDIPETSPLTIAGVTDTSFNGAYAGGTQPQSFISKSNDRCSDPTRTCQMTWRQVAADAGPSSGGTVTGMNEDTIEHVQLKNCTSTTCDADFYRPHDSTAQIGVDAVVPPFAANGHLIQDLKISNSSGTALWMPGSYHAILNRVGIATSGTDSVPQVNTNFSIAIGDSSFIHINDSAILGFPWAIQGTRQFNLAGSGCGPFYIYDSFIGSGIELDHGCAGVFLKNTVAETTGAGVVAVDPTNYWNGTQAELGFDNAGMQDNGNGVKSCFVFYKTIPTTSNAAANTVMNLSGMNGQCIANTYFKGGMINNLPSNAAAYDNGTAPRGILGVYVDSNQMEAEVRGEQAHMGPAIVPYESAAVITDPASWTCSGCTKTTGKLDPLGTFTAGELTSASTGSVTVYTKPSFTPVVNDQILFGGYVKTTTVGKIAQAGGSGSAFLIDNAGSSNFTFVSTVAGGNQVNSNYFDGSTLDDWWHPIVSYAKVGTANGGTGQIRMFLQADLNRTMDYWQPFFIYIPASANIPEVEVMRWRQQLLHGWTPASASTGILYAPLPISLPADPTTNDQAANKHYVDSHASGGVSGPVSSVVGNAACWNNTTGTLLNDCGSLPPALFNSPALVEQFFPLFSGTGISSGVMAACASGQSAGAGVGAGSATPAMNQITSGAVSGNCAGVISGSGAGSVQAAYYTTRSPIVQWGFGFSASGDFTSNARFWVGLVDSACSLATFTGSDTPACSYGAIRVSTSAGDTTFKCVSDSGTGTPQVTDLGVTPTTAYQTARVSIAPGSVTCSVGPTSASLTTVTNSTTVPGNKSLYNIIANTTLTSSATHVRIANGRGYSSNGTY